MWLLQLISRAYYKSFVSIVKWDQFTAPSPIMALVWPVLVNKRTNEMEEDGCLALLWGESVFTCTIWRRWWDSTSALYWPGSVAKVRKDFHAPPRVSGTQMCTGFPHYCRSQGRVGLHQSGRVWGGGKSEVFQGGKSGQQEYLGAGGQGNGREDQDLVLMLDLNPIPRQPGPSLGCSDLCHWFRRHRSEYLYCLLGLQWLFPGYGKWFPGWVTPHLNLVLDTVQACWLPVPLQVRIGSSICLGIQERKCG